MPAPRSTRRSLPDRAIARRRRSSAVEEERRSRATRPLGRAGPTRQARVERGSFELERGGAPTAPSFCRAGNDLRLPCAVRGAMVSRIHRADGPAGQRPSKPDRSGRDGGDAFCRATHLGSGRANGRGIRGRSRLRGEGIRSRRARRCDATRARAPPPAAEARVHLPGPLVQWVWCLGPFASRIHHDFGPRRHGGRPDAALQAAAPEPARTATRLAAGSRQPSRRPAALQRPRSIEWSKGVFPGAPVKGFSRCSTRGGKIADFHPGNASPSSEGVATNKSDS